MTTPSNPSSRAATLTAGLDAARLGDFSGTPAALRVWAGDRKVLDLADLFAFERTIADLAAAWTAHGYTDATINAWIASGTTLQDRHDRRAAARIATLVLDDHLVPGDEWTRSPLPDLTSSQRRPLLPFELATCRTVVEFAGDNRPAWGTILGLREASAGSTEISAVTATDVDLSRRTVRLAGNAHTLGRTGPLTTWAVTHVAEQLATKARAPTPTGSLVYEGDHTPGSAKAAAAPGMTMTNILALAWISADDVGPDSVRNTHARILFGGGNPLPVQRFLGKKSLDQAMREIGEKPHQPARNRRKAA